ncbi:MAG: carboxypeptidase regulatory-like domain-containing protein [Kiritimatiellia bacterium]
MNAKAIAVLLTMIAADIAYGQIQGKVVDIAGTPIPGVAVSIEGTSYEAETDEKGQYSISYFPGQFTVNYEKADYFSENLALSLAVKDVFPAKKIIMSPMPPADSLSVIGPPDRPYIQLLPSMLITPSRSETEPGEGSLNSFNPDFGKSARYTFAGDYLVLPNTAEIGFIQRSAAIRKAKGARPGTDYSIYKFRRSDRGTMYLTVTSSPFPEELGTKPGCDDCMFREPVPALSDGFYAFIMSRTERDMWSDAFLSHKALNERIYVFKISADTSEWYKVKSIHSTSSRKTQASAKTSDPATAAAPLTGPSETFNLMVGTWKGYSKAIAGLLKITEIETKVIISEWNAPVVLQRTGKGTNTTFQFNIISMDNTSLTAECRDGNRSRRMQFSFSEDSAFLVQVAPNGLVTSVRLRRVKPDEKVEAAAP